MTDETFNRKNCQCKYCGGAKKTQNEINQDLGLRAPSSSPLKAEIDARKPKLRQVPNPQMQISPGGPICVDRVSELRSNRCFRSGEIIWSALDPPIQGEQEQERIDFWPVLVKDSCLKTKPQHNIRGSWTVSQTYQYKVKFLGLRYSEVVPEHALLPYQAYGPSPVLVNCLRIKGDPSLLNGERPFSGARLRPLGSDLTNYPQLTFEEAATPFAFAIQISAHLLRFWTPDYEFAFIGEVPSWTESSLTDPAPGPIQRTRIKEIRHEGLWWGAERIWIDEVVRLIPGRDQLSPDSVLISPASPHAKGRGVLMKINGIISHPGNGGRHCKVSGTLYELADEGYQEKEPKSMVEQVSGRIGAPEGLHIETPILTPFVNMPLFANGVPQERVSQGPSNFPLFTLPNPPSGCKLLPITHSGYEMVLDVAMIAGRFYPELLQNPLLQSTLESGRADDPLVSQLRALCGLDAGVINAMECDLWCETRSAMVKQAIEVAQNELVENWKPEAPHIMEEGI